MTAIGRQLRTALEREDELLRLRTLLSTLMEAVEPFAELGGKIPGGDTDDENEVWWEVFDDDPLTYGDLRRAREAYLKAKSQTNKEG